MKSVLSQVSFSYERSDSFKKLKKIIPIAIAATVIVSLFVNSALLAAALGVSVAKAAEISQAAYDAWKVGSSVREAIGATIGGGLVGLAVSFILGWGVNKVLGSTWLKGM